MKPTHDPTQIILEPIEQPTFGAARSPMRRVRRGFQAMLAAHPISLPS